MAKFFRYLWAQDGDKTAIPDPIQPDGSVSWDAGFGNDYQLNPINPNHKDVPRTSFNQALYDITDGIKQYQTNGFPDFVTAAENGGSPYPYAVNAIVRYDDGGGVELYVSLVDNNITLPSDTNNWTQLDFDQSVSALYLVGFIPFGPGVVDGDVVYFNNSVPAFEKALATGTAQRLAVGIADVTNSRVQIAGIAPYYTGLTPNRAYYLSGTTPGAISLTPSATYPIQIGISPYSNKIDLQITQLRALQKVTYTGSGSFVVPADVYGLYFDAIAGGGGGGGSGGKNTSDEGYPGGGGGGAAGESVHDYYVAVVPGDTINISVGAAGTGGTAGVNSTGGGNGTTGGDTVIQKNGSPVLTLAGGDWGSGSTSITSAANISSGADGGNPSGHNGESGFELNGATGDNCKGGGGGNGSNSPFGLGGRGGAARVGNSSSNLNARSGRDGTGYGSGGGGAGAGLASGNTLSGQAGGNGAPGVVYVTYMQ